MSGCFNKIINRKGGGGGSYLSVLYIFIGWPPPHNSTTLPPPGGLMMNEWMNKYLTGVCMHASKQASKHPSHAQHRRSWNCWLALARGVNPFALTHTTVCVCVWWHALSACTCVWVSVCGVYEGQRGGEGGKGGINANAHTDGQTENQDQRMCRRRQTFVLLLVALSLSLSLTPTEWR